MASWYNDGSLAAGAGESFGEGLHSVLDFVLVAVDAILHRFKTEDWSEHAMTGREC